METKIRELFSDEKLVERIKIKLPRLFQIAELESKRGEKTGMEVGTIREKIVTALLIYKFGEGNVETNIPSTEAEIDVKLFGSPISIKTFTESKRGGIKGVKLNWTVDAQNAFEFGNNFRPSCGMILVHIKWGSDGSFYYIPQCVQEKTMEALGRENYIQLPKLLQIVQITQNLFMKG